MQKPVMSPYKTKQHSKVYFRPLLSPPKGSSEVTWGTSPPPPPDLKVTTPKEQMEGQGFSEGPERDKMIPGWGGEVKVGAV